MKNYYSQFQKPFLPNKQFNLNKKQIFGLVFVLFCFVFSIHLYAQDSPTADTTRKKLTDLILSSHNDPATALLTKVWIGNVQLMEYILKAVSYIAKAQLDSTNTIASIPLGNSGMFNTITFVLTLFASLGCAYKIVTHYFKTEKFDNVSAFTGFFSYVPILVLFIFSNQIVTLLVSTNQKINTTQISNISNKVANEIEQVLVKDFNLYKAEVDKLDEIIKNEDSGFEATIVASLDKGLLNFTEPFKLNIKYFYFSFFSIILVSAMAIPTVILTMMVKVLLTLGVIGAKIVFLLAFIPGFENSWRTYMLNILNILLWIPIFNVIIAFILAIISLTIVDDSMQTGQIIWLSILAVIGSTQALSLTTSTAQIIVNGAGAGMAGALGSMGSMSAMGMVGSAASAGASVAVAGVTGGASVVTAMNSKAPTKKE